MIQFLVSAIFVALGLFILVILLSLMFFVVMKLLGLLFPARFGRVAKAASVMPKQKKKAAKKGGRMEDRCFDCDKLGVCPSAMSGNVPYPCRMYGAKAAPENVS